jgi:D-alanyl-D-alanine carboxypeptidase (penicillin-binding protein 5/6)
MTAIATGVGTAYLGIAGIKIIQEPQIVGNIVSTLASVSSAAAKATDLVHLSSKHVLYEAEPVEEDVEDDITFTGETLTAANGSSDPSVISAAAYSVQSLDHNNTLIQKDADRALPIASVTKLITAVVAKKFFDEDDLVTITSSVLDTEGNTGKFRLNEKFKVKEILYPLLLVSSNDAAEALSQGYDSRHGKGKFVKAMNDWANGVGAYRTYFRDASGLSPQNVSTAHDLALISKWIQEHEPEIFNITLTKSKTIRTHTWVNPTHFLNLSSYTGGKNGYTTEANLTNISLFSLGEPKRLYSVVLLGSKNREADTLKVLNQAVK